MRNGARNPSPARAPPTSGPLTEPIRKLVDHRPDTRPRCSGGEMRITSASDDTVNIVEPMPPTERKTRSCQ